MVLVEIQIIINNNIPLVDGSMVDPNDNNNIICIEIIIINFNINNNNKNKNNGGEDNCVTIQGGKCNDDNEIIIIIIKKKNAQYPMK